MSAFVARASKKNSHQSCQSASGGMEGGEGSCSTSTTKIKGTFSRIYEEEKENLEPECSGTERALNDLSGEPTDKVMTAAHVEQGNCCPVVELTNKLEKCNYVLTKASRTLH